MRTFSKHCLTVEADFSETLSTGLQQQRINQLRLWCLLVLADLVCAFSLAILQQTVKSVVPNIFSTKPPSSNCPLFQAPLTLNKL